MLDFKRIIKNSDKYNFHSHTQFCDGHAVMEDFVIEAINEGFTDYGFSPHSPIPFSSPCNMNENDVKLYVSEFKYLEAKYKSKINLYLSMEIDYINEDWGPSNSYFDSIPLDYKIGSVHFIPSFTDDSYVDIDGRYDNFKLKMHDYFNDDIEAVVISFFRQTMKMIDAGGFNIIGHFDKIGHNAGHFCEGIEKQKWYIDLVKEAFSAVMDNNIIIELNTKAWNEHKRFFPNTMFFDMIKQYDAPILINSDAHFPHLINAGRDDAQLLLNGK